MQTSEQINEIATALAKAQGEMDGASKSAANPFFKSKYADLSSVWDACREPLSKNGLSVVQLPRVEYTGTPEIVEYITRSGETRQAVKVLTTVWVMTRLLHSSGQFFNNEVSTILPSGDPQAVGSAITYLRRYALQSVVGVAPEDDDAEAAQVRGKLSQPSQPTQVKQMPPKGFDDWRKDLEAVATEGFAALEKAWKASRPEFREHLRTTDAGWIEKLKADATRNEAAS